jgi:hypothetical protein
MRAVVVVLVVLVSTGLAGGVLVSAGASGTGDPVPVTGVAFKGASHLHLLVASNPPFILDVDSGRVTRIRAPVVISRGVLSVTAVAGVAGVVVAGGPTAQIYVVRARGARPVFLGGGSYAVPGSDGRSVWIKSVSGSACAIRQVELGGHQIGQAHSVACNETIQFGGSLGLIAGRTRVIDQLTGQTLLTTPYGVLAVAGKTLVLAGPEKAFTLLDSATGTQRKLAWPSILSGLDEPKADYQGRFVALAFSDPAWQFGAHQAMDLWLLDTRTGALTHLPGMPTFVDLKFTSMEWTRDGRLVVLGENGGAGFVAVWRPGAATLQVKWVRLPLRTSGSDSFASLP